MRGWATTDAGARLPSTPRGLGRAALLGVVHGPAELLPVSSSAHVALLGHLLNRDGTGADPEVEQALAVALHAGTAAVLLVALRAEATATVGGLDRGGLVLLAAASAPAAVAGLVLERPVEERLRGPRATAAGLLAGAAALALADLLAPQHRGETDVRPLGDGLALGLAQAAALVPGLSRNGMTLAAARCRGIARPDAERLSRRVALPVVLGATGLKAARLLRRGLPPGTGARLAVGTAASAASTLAALPLLAHLESGRSFAPYAAYRAVLAAAVLATSRGGDGHGGDGPGPRLPARRGGLRRSRR